MNDPRIALVGRPNVGKSTLFNRLVHSRLSITDAMPGVTRDTVEAAGELSGRGVTYIDTGGYGLQDDRFSDLVRGRSIESAQQADIVLFVLDVTDLNAEDEHFAELLRPMAEKTVLVVNKVDSEKREQLLGDFYSLGFTHLVAVSAAHGLGLDELEREVAALLPPPPRDSQSSGNRSEGEPEPYTQRIRVAILGKPNSGKSTLSNRLLGRERSIVSEHAGTTRDIVGGTFSWKGWEIEVLDTAGIRRKRSVTDSVEYYSVNRAVHAAEACDVAVLTVDAQDGLAEQDKKIAQVVIRRGKAVVVALNKWDLMSNIPNTLQAVKDRITFIFPVLDYAPVVPVSAVEGSGTEQLLNKIRLVYSQSTRRVETGELNRHLERWTERTPPPVIGRGRLKLRYMTQVSTQPVTFVLFVNRQRGIPESYLGYIRNCIRKDLGFSHVPVKLELRSSRRQ
ncbi:MAG: ribosome biogenesis GTPase Der [Spirochaetales bacterium]